MSGEHDNELGESFRVTLENSKLTDALIDAGDMSLTNLLSVLNEIPLLKWITTAGNTV